MIRKMTTIGVGLAVATALAVSASPASAATYHTTHTYLHFPSRLADAKATTRFHSRVLTLHGFWVLYGYSAHWTHPNNRASASKLIGLNGRYRWVDYLRRHGKAYTHVTRLRNLRSGGTLQLIHTEPGKAGDGTYNWGSTLERPCPPGWHVAGDAHQWTCLRG